MRHHPYRQPLAIGRSADEQLAREALTNDLIGGEQLLWVGRPKQGVYLNLSDAFLIPFSLFFGGGAIVVELLAIVSKVPFLCGVLCIPHVLVGTYLIVGRFFWDARKRARTFYGITNQRALIAFQGFTRNLIAVDLANLVEVSLDERADGTGSISLGKRSRPPYLEESSWPGAMRKDLPKLRRIAGAQDVFKLIAATQKASRRTHSNSSRSVATDRIAVSALLAKGDARR